MATQQHSAIGELAFALLGVGAFAVVADSAPRFGKILMVIMVGFLFIWLTIHGTGLSQIISKIQNIGA